MMNRMIGLKIAALFNFAVNINSSKNEIMKKMLIISLICFAPICICRAQSEGWFENHPISIVVGKQNTTAVPFYNTVKGPYNLSIGLGVEWSHWEGERGKLFQTANVGWLNSKYSHMGLNISTSLGYRYKTGFGLFADVALEVGAQQTFRKEAIYEFKNGTYEQVTDYGKLFGLVGGQLSIGYSIKNGEKPIDLFFQYRPTVLLPYPDLDILPQEVLNLGLRFNIK